MDKKRSLSPGLGALFVLAVATAATATRAQEPAASAAEAQAGPQSLAIAGRVVDAAGAPAAGARISSYWTFDEADPGGRPAQRMETDEDGAFRGDVQVPAPGPFALLVLSADGSQAGLVQLASSADLTSIAVHLTPSVHVRGSIASPELGHAVRWTNTFWRLADSELTIAGAASAEARIDLVLPAGHYRWFAYGEELRSRGGEARLAVDVLEHDLGTIEIPATFLALNRGKPLPAWHVSEARGVPLEQATLEAFRGRWLLIAFFAHNSGPAVLADLPELIRFHETTRGTPRAERFRLVAFHDGSLPNLAALDQALAPLRERVWGGRTIPFPLLIDATDATFDAYGIESLPTLVLVDPDGKLVGEASLADLVLALEREEAEAQRDAQGPREER